MLISKKRVSSQDCYPASCADHHCAKYTTAMLKRLPASLPLHTKAHAAVQSTPPVAPLIIQPCMPHCVTLTEI